MNDVQKAAFKKAGQTYWDAALVVYQKENVIIEQLIADGKVFEVTPDAAAIKVFHDGAVKMWDEAGSKDEASRKAVELIKAWNAAGEAFTK